MIDNLSVILYKICYLLLVFKYYKNTSEHLRVFIIRPEGTNFDLNLVLKIWIIQILTCSISTSIVYSNIPKLLTIFIYINLLKIMFYFSVAIIFIIFDFLEMNYAVFCLLALKAQQIKSVDF